MQQVLINLLSNAYKYSPAGGVVDIGFETADAAEGRLVGIVVRDQGIGMTPEQLSRVCERFYRADTSGKILGTGLGMSIVKEIVELHGGELQLASKVGVGTTVTFWLPLADPASSPAKAPPAA
jgi:signal transduction histidine kinase